MNIFNRKENVKLEDFCLDFYENQILNPIVGKIDASNVYPEVIKKSITEVYPEFAKVDLQKLKKELIILRFELFALAWTHKFLSGKLVVAQSAFTKRYLHDKERDDIWKGMEPYNRIIDSAVLHWLTSLGRMNLGFNYRMREDLTAENIKDAKKLGISIDESIERVNNRLYSEPAWKQKLLLGPLVFTFCNQLGLNSNELNEETTFRLAAVIKGLYDGAQQSWDKIEIKG